jgi:hypothetical protein
VLFGDESYSLGRSLRTRNILLGAPASKLDYQIMFDTYAQTRYMSWLSWLQFAFGPSPYAVRLLNGVLFVGGGALLYRLARRGFGAVPALGGLAALLFLPSSLFWSVSLLKESVLPVHGCRNRGRRPAGGAGGRGVCAPGPRSCWRAVSGCWRI